MKEEEYVSFNSVIVAGLVLILIFISYTFSGHNAQCICYGEKFDVYNQKNSNISQVCYDICTNGHYYLKDAKCEYNEQGKYFENVKFGATVLWGCGL